MGTHRDIDHVCLSATAWRYPFFLSISFVFALPVFHVGRVSALRGAYEELVPSASTAVLVVVIIFVRVCENGVRKQMRTHNSPTR